MLVKPTTRTCVLGSALFANLAFAFRLSENNGNHLSRSHSVKDNTSFEDLAGAHSESLNIDNDNFFPVPITPVLPISHFAGFPPIRHTPLGPPANRVLPTSPISPTNRGSLEGVTNPSVREELVRPLRLWTKDTDTFILNEADGALREAQRRSVEDRRWHNENTIELVPANAGNDEATRSSTDDELAKRNHKAENGRMLTLVSDEELEAFATTAERNEKQTDLITLDVDEDEPIFENTFDEDRYTASDAFSDSSFWEELAKGWDETLAPLTFDEYWSRVWLDDLALDASDYRPLQGDIS